MFILPPFADLVKLTFGALEKLEVELSFDMSILEAVGATGACLANSLGGTYLALSANLVMSILEATGLTTEATLLTTGALTERDTG